MALSNFIQLFSGLAMFLYGMSLMGDGLQKAAGKKMKDIISFFTHNRLLAVIVGCVVTGIIQSSSATTVMVVGFVNANLMTLSQAIGIIMGANIGTTVTAQLVSFDIEAIAPFAIAVGVLIMFLKKGKQAQNLSQILIGFGILFVGMVFMKESVIPLREYDGFKNLLVKFGNNPFLGILIGFLLTLVLQSSSASIGILLALASQGLMPLSSALPILYGDNIGTCTTAIISSLTSTGPNAKRAAVMHLIFNVIGTLIFAFVLNHPIQWAVVEMNPDSVTRQIANAHTLFNLINVIIQFPFADYIVKLACKIIPDDNSKDNVYATFASHLDERMLLTPGIALQNAINECILMGEMAKFSSENAIKAFTLKSQEHINETFKTEEMINEREKLLADFLLKLSNKEISAYDRIIVENLLNVVKNIERIGDHAENIAELAQTNIDDRLDYSRDALEDINLMFTKVMASLDLALEARRDSDFSKLRSVEITEDQVDIIEKVARSGHIDRLNRRKCDSESGIMFLDLFSNLERISDHALNIAKSILYEK